MHRALAFAGMGVLMMVSGTSLAGPATAATQKPGSVVFIYDNIGHVDQSEMHRNHWDWFTCNIPAITCYHQVQVAFEGSEDNKPETVDHDLSIGPVQHLQVLDTYTLNGGIRGRGGVEDFTYKFDISVPTGDKKLFISVSHLHQLQPRDLHIVLTCENSDFFDPTPRIVACDSRD